MSGKRLLDLAALFNASRGIAQKHLALRSRQLDVYNQTSTLSKVIRSQTDRVTETAKAASFLASRLNEQSPSWASDVAESASATITIPSKKSTKGASAIGKKEGIHQDHFYESLETNSVIDAVPTDELEVLQEKANRYPSPDGTIPPSDSDINIIPIDHDSLPTRLQDEPKKQPLDHRGFQPASSGSSTIPIPTQRVTSIQDSSRFSIPSHTADAFDDSVKGDLEAGHDKDSFYVRSTHTSVPSSSQPAVILPEHTSSTQDGRSEIQSNKLNADTFYQATNSEIQPPDTESEDIPEDINTNLFHSPRVARVLGGKTQTTLRETAQVNSGKQSSFTGDGQQGSQSFRYIPNALSNQSEKLDSAPNNAAEILHHEGNRHELRESKVPSSRIGRLWNYGGLAAGMFGGAISESFRRAGGNGGQGSFWLSAGNMERLVTKLSRMRGAALKLGQMVSFQDSKMLPPAIQEVLQRVQDRADYMPPSQRNTVLVANLGPNWRDLYSSFDEKPLAAASIGQVHSAVLKSNGARVAVKVQYPGVADSIDSDLNNLAILLTASRILPKGLFLDKTIANARTELAWECDYLREADCGRRFEELLADEPDVFVVPKTYPEASGKQVITMEFMDGVGVTKVQNFTQDQKDWIGTQILRLCLREITEFKFMQTDPNWTNFLFNTKTNKLELLDFGASREYPEEFITKYAKLLAAASKSDKETVAELSVQLGYLTGHESKAMLNAHIASVMTLAEPFLDSSPEIYDFKDQSITERVKALIPVMIRERLSPPPEETYSLHRKLSGAFLLCARLGSRVRCRNLFVNSMEKTGILN